ncbi:MAG: acyl-CoA synthetase FdrA [Actinophytocola sp.]|uniref:acyl-CoA synthetase FdrA n=1 Tax=Actinophytocola sp. TaxID=1872138 RepID=UPI0013287F64|nr:acyl-CoA synthetase FdrA [Actinophytocola sp.]MPZ78928.1 acyl-CoA synthetase FdrA [Actinophytocola sp.]
MLYSIVKPNNYQDSLRLMRLSNLVADTEGINRVSIMMGTPMNKDILRNAGLTGTTVDEAKPTDLLILADVVSAEVGESLVSTVDAFLSNQASMSGRSRLPTARSLERALSLAGDANLAIVSIPGEYVAAEVERLLDHDLHVFIFSDNVSIDDEVTLKRKARERGLLVMGPDCGTGSIGGLPLAFTNAVHPGNIGLAGASGTGLQEVMAQIDGLGGGVSHAIGLGGRDLGTRVGASTCLRALRALDGDASTDVIVLISKPPAARVRDDVIGVAERLSKPVVAILLGERPPAPVHGNVHYAHTLDEAARIGVELAGTRAARSVALRPAQQWVKGLYTGGTLAVEAAMLLRESLGIPQGEEHDGGYLLRSGGHEVIDLGDDAYTRGRPHPMIDPSIRNERLAAVFDDPRNAVLLLDVVLGYGSDPDPAGALAPRLAKELAALRAAGRDLAVVASVCGTENDPQSLSTQTLALEQAGVTVMPSNAAAVRHALRILRRQRAPEPPANGANDTNDADDADEPVRRLLAQPPRVINIGLRGFAETLFERGAHVVHYDWRPAAGGDRKLQALIDALR